MLLMAVLQKVEHWNKVMRAQGLREAPGFRVSFRIDEFQSLYLRRTKHACSSAVVELRHRVFAIPQNVKAIVVLRCRLFFQVESTFTQQVAELLRCRSPNVLGVRARARQCSSDAQAYHQFQSARWEVKES